MITDIQVSIAFQGKNFSPKKAEELLSIKFEDKCELGDIGRKGLYKDKVIPYGMGWLEAPSDICMHERLMWLAEQLTDILPEIIELGADDDNYITVGYFYKDQCNLALDRKELALLSSLGIDFWFSCYEDEQHYLGWFNNAKNNKIGLLKDLRSNLQQQRVNL